MKHIRKPYIIEIALWIVLGTACLFASMCALNNARILLSIISLAVMWIFILLLQDSIRARRRYKQIKEEFESYFEE